MFERFTTNYPNVHRAGTPAPPARLGDVAGFDAFMTEFAGATFEHGLYRIHDRDSAGAMTRSVVAAFPALERRIASLFAYDWRGCQLLLDSGRMANGDPLVTIVDVGVGEASTTTLTFHALHDSAATEQADRLFLRTLFQTWAALNPTSLPLARDLCVGYRVPLQLGGSDTMNDFEVTDIDVFWSITSQIRARLESLPPGTPIRGIKFRRE